MANIDWKKTLATVAPTVATALGGPLAGMAVTIAAQALGIKPDEEALAEAVSSGNPDVLLKLKEVDANLKIKLKELDIELNKVNAEDRASARNREVIVRDASPKILAYITTIGFFSVIGYILINGLGLVDPNMIGLLGILIGNVSSKVEQIFNYYFGSSAGSARKTEQFTDWFKKVKPGD
jgi:hypothetical protein